jgi:hypothetical protein
MIGWSGGPVRGGYRSVALLLGLMWGLSGCSSSSKGADAGKGDAGAAQDAIVACCVATDASDPGSEPYPCGASAAGSSCSNVGRRCVYGGCQQLDSCTCRSLDGAAPNWTCAILPY